MWSTHKKEGKEKALEGTGMSALAHKDFKEATINMFNELNEAMSEGLEEVSHQLENINQEIEIMKIEIVELKVTKLK